MTNTVANRYRCVCLFSAFIFSFSNWRQSLVAIAQKTCVCYHGNSGSNTGPSRWSDDEGFHQSRTDTPVFTAGRHHVTKLVYAVFMRRGDRSVSEDCTKLHVKMWFTVSRNRVEAQSVLSRFQNFYVSEAGRRCRGSESFHRPKLRSFCLSMLLHMFLQVSSLFVRANLVSS